MGKMKGNTPTLLGLCKDLKCKMQSLVYAQSLATGGSPGVAFHLTNVFNFEDRLKKHLFFT